MSNLAFDLSGELDQDEAPPPRPAREMVRVPRITIDAYCETPALQASAEAAVADRRMSRAKVRLMSGGIAAACTSYTQSPTPNLLVLESRAAPDELLSQIDTLSEACDVGTKVIVIGHANDVMLYRALMERGVDDYLAAPLDAMTLIEAICRLYREEGAQKTGRAVAFIGAKGGVGSSTIAHNVAAAMARETESDVMLADMDLAFGTAGLNFNIETGQGMADAVRDSDRLDEMLLDRLLAKCSDHLRLLAAPATLDKQSDCAAATFDRMLEVSQANIPFVVLDIPHLWTAWAQRTLTAVDEVVISANPDLANLRNVKNLVEFLKHARPSDGPPRVVLNMVGMPKRPEIKPKDFADALKLEFAAVIGFDAAAFGTAANEGRPIAEASPNSRISASFAEVARALSGRSVSKQKSKPSLASLLRIVKSRQ